MGLFNWLYNGVSWILLRWHDLWGSIFDPDSGWAWGLSIVGLVVVIRIALIPLFVKQIKAQRGLQALQPQMKALKEKHGHDRERMSQEMMKLYKETGTNPLSSCLPILVQAPFFFALFHVLSYVAQGKTVGVMNAAEVESMADATIFGAPLSAKFTDANGDPAIIIVTLVMIVLMSASQFITQRQLMLKNMPAGQDNPLAQQQKIMLYLFPLMFAVFGINFPIGVLIYWLTTNLWTMGQQFYVIRRNPTPGSPAYDALQERRAAKAAHKAAKKTDSAGSAPTDGAAPGSVNGEVTDSAAKPSTPPKPTPARIQPRKQSKAKRQSKR
ncbi:MAG: membrane protein insertase YidC [Candidatus Nanopelagicales bacterium]